MQSKENADEPEDEFTGAGRIVIDLGDLSAEAENACLARGISLSLWIREAIAEKVAREHESAPFFTTAVQAEIESLQSDSRITPLSAEILSSEDNPPPAQGTM